MVRKIVEKVSEEQLKEDLEKYRQRALEMGAVDAKIITSDMVIIDERVRAKCLYPKCHYYGTNANCPPYSTEPERTKKVVSGYRYALLVKMEISSDLIAGPEARDKKLFKPSSMKLQEMVSKIEAEAFYDGYYLALGFACGACKSVFCPNIECSALVPGQACRQPFKARPSMEAVGMDVYAMATKAGWDIYPIGGSSPPSEVPKGLRVGLVLIY